MLWGFLVWPMGTLIVALSIAVIWLLLVESGLDDGGLDSSNPALCERAANADRYRGLHIVTRNISPPVSIVCSTRIAETGSDRISREMLWGRQEPSTHSIRTPDSSVVTIERVFGYAANPNFVLDVRSTSLSSNGHTYRGLHAVGSRTNSAE